MAEHDDDEGGPPRWLDDPDAPPGVSAALRGKQAERPSAAQRRRVAAALGPLLAPEGSSGGGTGGGATPWRWLGPAAVIGGVIAVVAGGIHLARPAADPVLVPAPAEPAPVPEAEPGRDHRDPDTRPEVAAPEVEPGPPRADRAAVEPPRRGAPAAPQPRDQGQAEGEEDEIAIIARAQDQLRADSAAEALRTLARHRDRFPDGALVQEREVLEIDALIRAGRPDRARAAAERFLAAHPGSALAARVRELASRAATTRSLP
jgi:hypothetical protein